MTKGLPDSPVRATTADFSFPPVNAAIHRCSPFVRAWFEDALVHLPTRLRGAFATNLKALELAKGTWRDLLLSNDHGVDSAKAVQPVFEGLGLCLGFEVLAIGIRRL